MNSRSIVNIFLFVTLVFAIYFFYQKTNTKIETKRLTSLNIDNISEITIQRDDNNSITFKKNNSDSWYMLKPYPVKAHQFRINTLLKLTQTPIDNAYPISDLNLSDYSLSPPLAKITFNSTDILFGKANPINNKRYLLTEDKLSLINDLAYPLINAQAASLVNLSIIPDDFIINKISTSGTVIFLDTNNSWTSQGKNKLSIDQIQNTLQHWKQVQAFAVHKYMPRKQLGEIKLYSGTQSIVLKIEDDEPWLILSLPKMGIEYHIDKSSKDILLGLYKEVTNDA